MAKASLEIFKQKLKSLLDTFLKKKSAKKENSQAQGMQAISMDDFSETEAPEELTATKVQLPAKPNINHSTVLKALFLKLKNKQFKEVWNEIQNYLKTLLKNRAAAQAAAGGSNQFKSGGLNIDWVKIPDLIFAPENRTKWHRGFLICAIMTISYGTGKTIALFVSGEETRLEDTAPSLPPVITKDYTPAEIQIIETANIFRSELKRADEDGKKKMIDKKTKCIAASQKTTLPITLVNTVVLQDSVKSIASVQLRSKTDTLNFREGETIEEVAKIDKITRLEVILKNLKNGNCEYLRSKDLLEKKLPMNVMSASASKAYLDNKSKNTTVANKGNSFDISKKFIGEKMKDLSTILTQAKAIQLRNPDGTLAFKITEIVPDSVYTNLGIQNEDIITGIDGKSISDLNEVMTKFGRINELEQLTIDVQRDGTKVTLDYKFSQ
ncbi:MAG: PDZ domain-containing protein [Bacteriovoracaceae bacterium]|nr:PDZ domain-containing protein [Bacteriovoracaceae bacterium]